MTRNNMELDEAIHTNIPFLRAEFNPRLIPHVTKDTQKKYNRFLNNYQSEIEEMNNPILQERLRKHMNSIFPEITQKDNFYKRPKTKFIIKDFNSRIDTTQSGDICGKKECL